MANFKSKAKAKFEQAKVKATEFKEKAQERAAERDVRQQERAAQARVKQKLRTQELEVQAEHAKDELGLIKRQRNARTTIGKTRQAKTQVRSDQFSRFQPSTVFSSGSVFGSLPTTGSSRSPLGPSGRIDGGLFGPPPRKAPVKRRKKRKTTKKKPKKRKKKR